MADSFVTEPAKEALGGYSPDGQKRIARAISLLEQDDLRDQLKVDFRDTYDGKAVWGFAAAGVSISFVEDGGRVYITYVSLLSAFRQDLWGPG